MGKVLKVVAVIAAIAVNVIPGAGQAISAGIFGAIGVTSVAAAAVSIGLGYAAIAGVTALGLSSLQSLARGNQAGAASQLSRLTLTSDPSTPRKIVAGTTAMNCDALFQEASGTDQEYIDMIVAVAAHKVSAIASIYSEDKLMWTSAGGVQGLYVGYLTVVDVRLEGTRSNGIAINGGGHWNADCTLTGCAYLHLRIKRSGNTTKIASPFAAGIPSRITIIGDGMPVYDPRRDTTVGGSGAMRANDQTTWLFTSAGVDLGNNPALQALTFALGWKVGGVISVGAGVSPARLAMADWIAAANTCDEVITTIAGSQKRYVTAGVFSDDDAPGAVLDALCLHMNAYLRDTGGKIGIRMAINDLGGSLVSFNEDDLQGGYDWQPSAPLNDSYNIVRGSFTDPSTAALYQSVPYPALSIASPDGNNRTLPLDLPMIQDATRAQRVARQVLRRGQFGGTLSLTLGPRAWACEVGQPVKVTISGLGFVDKIFRARRQELKIINSADDAAAVCGMTLVEEDASIYAWSSGDANAVDPATAPVSYLPSSQPLLMLQGNVQNLSQTTGQITSGLALNPNNNFGLRALVDSAAITDSVVSSQCYINVAAFNLYGDFGTVTYPAVTIGPVIYNQTYFIWRNVSAPNSVGTSYGYSTSLSDALGVDKVYFGYILTRNLPGSGGSSGSGGGGSGTPYCVAPDAWVETILGPVRAREISVGDILVVLSDDLQGLETAPVEASVLGENWTCRITTEGGAMLRLSINTPVPRRGGGYALAANAWQQDVPVLRSGAVTWERVVSIDICAERDVQQITCHQRVYAAGDSPDAMILTHNLVNKP